MSTASEPPLKKFKSENMITKSIDHYIQDLNKTKLTSVLSDDLSKPLPLVKVYVGHVKNPKELSKIINILNEKLPLKELQHLKRVKKAGVLLCPVDYLVNIPSIQEFLETYVPELSYEFQFFREIDVPAVAPKLKKQCNLHVWSYNFHPNVYLEKLASDSFFSTEEINTHINYMKMVFEVAKCYCENASAVENVDIKEINATIVVDPIVDRVVAASFVDKSHPLQHSCMLAIDNVAKTQNGGAWGSTNQNLKPDCTLSGFNEDLMQHLQLIFPSNSFGARRYIKKNSPDTSEGEVLAKNSGETLSKEHGPYLCTGYFIYTMKEPCVMCAMGLVHARARRVFYAFDNVQYGALKSKTKLQAVPSLNHHFEVFTGFLHSEE